MDQAHDANIVFLRSGTSSQRDAAITHDQDLDRLVDRALRQPELLATDGWRRRLARVVRVAMVGHGFTRADLFDAFEARLVGAQGPVAERLRGLLAEAMVPGSERAVADVQPLLARLAGATSAEEAGLLIIAHLREAFGAGVAARVWIGTPRPELVGTLEAGVPADAPETLLHWAEGDSELGRLSVRGLPAEARDRLGAWAPVLQPVIRRLAEAHRIAESAATERRWAQGWRLRAELLAISQAPTSVEGFMRQAIALIARQLAAANVVFWTYDRSDDSLEARYAVKPEAELAVPLALFQEVLSGREPRTITIPSGTGQRTYRLAPVFDGESLRGVLQVIPAAAILDAHADTTLSVVAEALAQGQRTARFFEQLSFQAAHDALTGIPNRRTFEAFLDREIKLSQRHGTPLSVLVVDADHFKRYNDSYGHPAGDALLKGLADRMARVVRSTDFVARYGGEEFVVVLPHTDREGAWRAAEKLLEGIRTLHEHAPIEGLVTASIGVATFPADVVNPRELFGAADKAMYAAKHAGRNRVAQAGD